MNEAGAVERRMQRIRDVVALARAQGPVPAPASAYVPVSLQEPFTPDPAGRYRLTDLLAYHDEAFVQVAFLAVLRRAPDASGYAHYLHLLRGGCSKVDILGRIRYSPEGRMQQTDVEGLAIRYAIQRVYRLPLVGPVMRVVGAVAQGPTTLRNQRVFESHVTQWLDRMQQSTAHGIATLESRVGEAARAAGELDAKTTSALAANSAVVASLLRSKADIVALATVRDELARLSARTLERAEHASAMAALEAARAAQERAVAELGASLAAQIDARALRTDVDPLRHKVVELFATVKLARDEARRELDAALAAADVRLAEARLQLNARLDTVQAQVDAAGASLQQALDAKAGLDALAALDHDVRALSRDAAARHEAIEPRLTDLAARIERAQVEARERAVAIAGELRPLIDARAAAGAVTDIAGQVRVAVDSVNTLRQALAEAAGAWDQSARDLKSSAVAQERRLARLLQEARRRSPEPSTGGETSALADEERHVLDAFYARLEDRFRGARAEIKVRQGIWLPYVKAAKAGRRNAPVVDLGCGRGEWLEVLRDAGLAGVGVDINEVFLARCDELDLDVVAEDAVTYLQGLAPGSVGAITSFHLIEHLPLDRLLAMLDEAHRVLRPHGVLVLETPNPANLVVGACNFYLDPTHRNPLPPELMRFMLEARGFMEVEVLPLHPVAEDWLAGRDDPAALTINHFIYGAQDYGVIGRKG